MIVDILGTKYTVMESDVTEDVRLDGHDGYCDNTSKVCVVDRMPYKSINNVADVESRKKIILRHELIHAIFYECGLDTQSFAADETMVDWLAIQFPKIAKIFLECGCAG